MDLITRTRDESASLYLASLAPGSRPTQASALRTIAKRLGFESPTHVPWHKVNRTAILALRETLLEEYSPSTANRILAALRGTLRECWRSGKISREEYERREVSPVRGSRVTPGRALSAEEVECLTRELDVRDRAIILVMVCGGLRRAEVAGLTPADVSFKGDEAELRVVGKGNKERLVYLTGAAAHALAVAMHHDPNLGHAPIFRLSISGMAKRLARILRRLDATSHDLRRTYASVALDSGVDLATVQKVMGHADPRTTVRYDRRSVESEKDAARMVDNWVKGVK